MTERTVLGQWERGLALALVIIAGYLHGSFLFHAGGLWRDEVVSFNIASQPSLLEVAQAARFESSPSLFHFLLRGWVSLGPGATDLGARGLGFVIGLLLLAAVTWSARALRCTWPLFSLLLLGVSGLVIRTTDALRAYGLGMLWIALAVGAFYRLATAPSRRMTLLAGVCAVCAVQTLYQNAFLLLGIGLGALTLVVRQRQWRRALPIVGIGAVAAASLALYLPVFEKLEEIRPLVNSTVSFERLFSVAAQALRDGTGFKFWLWLALLAGGVGILGWLDYVPRESKGVTDGGAAGTPTDATSASNSTTGLSETETRNLAVYVTVTLGVSVAGFFLWLKLLGLPTQVWYYVPPLAVVCVCVDAAAALLISHPLVRSARAGLVAVAMLGSVTAASAAVHVRQTNVDLIAAELEQRAQPGDFILVDQWYCGTTFSRYFHGATAWGTLPPLGDQTLQRLDLFKQFMVAVNPNAAVHQRIVDTLKAGHDLWLVGGLPGWKEGQPPPAALPPAPQTRFGWNHDIYSVIWAQQAAHLIQTHAVRSERVVVNTPGAVNRFENLPLVRVQGFREPASPTVAQQ
jgi:hypothetical protein